MAVPDDEADRGNPVTAAIEMKPARRIGAGDHLAPPQEMQFVERKRCRQPVDDTAAGSAAVEPEHEPGSIGAPPRRERPHAEAPMQAMHQRRPGLDEREQRIPQERAVGEDPPAGVLRLRRERCGERRGQLLVGQRLAVGERFDVHRAHAVLLEVATRERHSALSSVGSFASSTRARRRSAPCDLPCAPPLPRSGERATGLRGFGIVTVIASRPVAGGEVGAER
jgi:hypothetical protein